MKSAFIIHGFNGDTLYTFGPWLKNVLQEKGFEVYAPEFPIRSESSFKKWSNILDNYKDKFKPDTIVVAHSIGNPFIIRYLTENNIKIKAYISVAGFCRIFNVPNRDDLNTSLIDFAVNENHISKIKTLVKHRYSLYSDNDHCVPFDILKDFYKSIESTPVFIPGVGHMGNRDNISKLPEIKEIIDKLEQE